MDKKIFMLFAFACITCVQAFCFFHPICIVNKIDKRQIQLDKLKDKETYQSIFIPYVAEQEDQSIIVNFLRDLRNVDIEIVNESGECLYRTTAISPRIGSHLSIDLSDLPEGYYTIYFKDMSGGIIYGSFDRYIDNY